MPIFRSINYDGMMGIERLQHKIFHKHNIYKSWWGDKRYEILSSLSYFSQQKELDKMEGSGIRLEGLNLNEALITIWGWWTRDNYTFHSMITCKRTKVRFQSKKARRSVFGTYTVQKHNSIRQDPSAKHNERSSSTREHNYKDQRCHLQEGYERRRNRDKEY